MKKRSVRWPRLSDVVRERRELLESQVAAAQVMASGECSERFPTMFRWDGEHEWVGELQPDGSTSWSIFEGPSE